jgi:hypothetical protein
MARGSGRVTRPRAFAICLTQRRRKRDESFDALLQSRFEDEALSGRSEPDAITSALARNRRNSFMWLSRLQWTRRSKPAMKDQINEWFSASAKLDNQEIAQ